MTTTIQPTLDASAHWDAIKALLTASPLGDHAYDFGKVPGADGNSGTLPTTYVLLTVERRYAAPNNGRSAVTGWRVSCRFVGTTSPNARAVGNWVTAALNEARVTVGGVQSTPITHESTNSVEPDDGMYSGLSQWIYAL